MNSETTRFNALLKLDEHELRNIVIATERKLQEEQKAYEQLSAAFTKRATLLQECESRLHSLTADRDQWKGRADQLQEERDDAQSRLGALQKLAEEYCAVRQGGRFCGVCGMDVEGEPELCGLNALVVETRCAECGNDPPHHKAWCGSAVERHSNETL